MNPYKLREIYKYLTRAKKVDPELPNVFPASKAPIPPKTQNVEEMEAINAFIRRERQQKAGGGMLVQPGFGGTRQGYREPAGLPGQYDRGSFTEKQQTKIKNAFPKTKFNFDDYKYGVPVYNKPGKQGGVNKDYTKVLRFIDKGFKIKEFKTDLLKIPDRNLIMANFELPQGVNEWNFNKYKYGIPGTGTDGENMNLGKRISKYIKDKPAWTLATDRSSAKGWMMSSMERLYNNQKGKTKNLTYEPIFEKINGKKIIIGFKDNTESGKGKTYYGLKKYEKKNNTPWINHGDYKNVSKFVDISKRSFNEPNDVIKNILKQKGINQSLKLNDILNFDRYFEILNKTTSKELLKNAIVKHHISGVGAGRSIDIANAAATKDLQLLTSATNNKVRKIENKLKLNGFVSAEDNLILKNLGASIRGADGKLYGGGSTTAIGGFKRIEKQAEEIVKGDKFNVKNIKTYLAKIGCPGKGKAYGGRIQFQEGLSQEVCMTRGAKTIQEKRIDSPAQKANFNKMMKVATVGKNMALLKDILGPYGLAGDVLLEGMIAVNKTLTGGTPFKESWQDSWLSSVVGGEYDEAGQKLGRQKLFELRSGLSEGAEEFGDYNRKVEEYYNLIGQRNNLDLFKGSGDLADTSQEFKFVDNKIKNAERELGRMETRINAQGGFEAAENEYNRKTAERQDADAATSLQSIGRLYVDQNNLNQMLQDDFSGLSSDALPMQKEPRPVLPNYETFKPELPTLSKYKNMYEEAGITPPEDKVLEQDLNQERFRQLFTQPGFMGASDTFFGDTVKMAGGGIAKLAGVSSGVAPVRGPNPQGLLSLKNRVRNY